MFDNVTAIFSANPVIARTATYIYACAEWIADAFEGKELLLEIYSRLLNPTAIALANYIVDLEAGPYAREYFAWNFNSGMAAIDAVLAHVLGRGMSLFPVATSMVEPINSSMIGMPSLRIWKLRWRPLMGARWRISSVVGKRPKPFIRIG